MSSGTNPGLSAAAILACVWIAEGRWGDPLLRESADEQLQSTRSWGAQALTTSEDGHGGSQHQAQDYCSARHEYHGGLSVVSNS
eukprot:4832243-Amphidinium_carterae.1